MSVPKQSVLPPLYGYVLTAEGPILYRDLMRWRKALAVERKQPFREQPFDVRHRVRGGSVERAQLPV